MEIIDVRSLNETAVVDKDLMNAGNHCIECGKTLTSFSNMLKHIRSVHNAANIKMDYRKSLICPICDAELVSKKSYEEHLLSEHDTKLDKINLEFVSVNAYSEWKRTIERKNYCMYVKRSGTKKNSTSKIEYLYCHRSGDYKKCGTGQRKLKKKGSNKIQKTCPSMIKVTFKEIDGRVSVEYVKTHLGHSFDVERMKINGEEKKSIAIKLASGMTFSEILASIEKPVGKFEPIHALTRKHLHNIRKEYNIPIIKEPRTQKSMIKSKNAEILKDNPKEKNMNVNRCDNVSNSIIYINDLVVPEKNEVICTSEDKPVQTNQHQNLSPIKFLIKIN